MLKRTKKVFLALMLSLFSFFLCAAFFLIPSPVDTVISKAATSTPNGIINTGLTSIRQNTAELSDDYAEITGTTCKNQIGWVDLHIGGTMLAPKAYIKVTKKVNAPGLSYLTNKSDVGGKGKLTLTIYKGTQKVSEYTTGKSGFDLTFAYSKQKSQEHTFNNISSFEYGQNYKFEVKIEFSTTSTSYSFSTGDYTVNGTYKRTLEYNVLFEKSYTNVYGRRVYPNTALKEAYYDEATDTYYTNAESIFLGWENSLMSTNNTTSTPPKIIVRPDLFGTISKNGAAATTYTNGTEIKDEGNYVIRLCDEAGGLYQEWKIKIDRTVPTFTIKDKKGGEVQNNGYFADDVKITFNEDIKLIYYLGDKLPTGNIALQDNAFTLSPNIVDENRTITVELYDMAGNTQHVSLNRYVTTEFGNVEDVEADYKLSSWWNVRLPKNRYPALTVWDYSFATEEEAFAFAKAKEYEHRVQKTTNGWTYSTADNYSNTQEYNDAATLDLCVEKWAKGYVSARQVYSTGTNNYYFEPTSLTKNSVPLPGEITTDYGFDKAFYIGDWFVFGYAADRSERSIKHSITATYIGDYVGGALVNASGATAVTVKQGTAWKEHKFNQGYYIIKESDSIFNETSYLVYYDKTAPTLKMEGTLGNGENREIETKDEFNGSHVVSLTFGAATDNRELSTDLLIKINGRGLENVEYRSCDELPTLSAENDYYGLYTISVYDRSKNVREIEVYIAPTTLPSWSYSSLSNDVKLRLEFNSNYKYNALKEIEIYNVLADGTLKPIETDGDGVEISFLTTEYVFYVGGKYQAKMIDIYERTVWTNCIFYKKGLPEGTLEGVQDGGVTRQNVTFSCASEYATYIYVMNTGEAVLADNDLYIEKVSGAQRTITFLAEERTSLKYMIAVHNALNEELFVEYTFEIDTICADVIIKDTDGVEIGYDSSTTKGFYIDAIEPGVSLSYYVNKDNGLNGNNYKLKTKIYADGTYYFTIKDAIGNTKTFTVLIDRVVQYQIAGDYVVKNDQIVAKEALTLTIMERYTTLNVSNGTATYENGATLNEGLYSVYSEDVYGNALSLSILIDTTAPTLTLDGVQNGGITRQSVTLSFEDGATAALTNSKGGFLEVLSNGRVFDVDGEFYVVVTDYAGNESLATFSIRTKINFSSNVLNNQITSDVVQVEFPNDVQLTIKRDGEEIDYQTRYVDVGAYEIYALDAIGNEVSFSFKIIDRLHKSYEFELPANWTITQIYCDDVSIGTETTTFTSTGLYILTLTDGTSNYELIIEIDATPPAAQIDISSNLAKITPLDGEKNNVTAVLYKDGQRVEYSYGSNITESGAYTLTLTDELGNEVTYEFEIPFALDVFAIVAIVAVSLIIGGIVVFVVIRSRKIRI